ncbi:MAG: thiamine pyrophosphate-binding protein [Actinomycetota bacterium]|jgi:acetolactate synthase-1/2/3 large subunit|nr:thiamine pyrophosphate-binding protein [Actinomycetota bacterium]|tara:strand:- start:351 stop:1991 length:1641 start_codon:yes stop_codon:yes gene_type:complete
MAHGGSLAARALKDAGVGAIFTLTGGHIMPILDGALDEDIPVIDVRHEQAAVHAADAYSRLNPGRIGCAVLTAGPGVTDGVTGIANAWRANSPILVIGGQGPFSNLRRGSLQEMDHVGMIRPISKWADACYQTDRIPEYIEMAVRTAVSGVPGPAFLEIPMDVLMAPASLDDTRFPTIRATPPTVHPDPADLQATLDVLATAERPVLLGGTGVKWSRGGAALARFAEATRIPVYLNGMGRGMLRADHPQFFNRTRRQAMKECDVFVLVGSPLDFRLRFGAAVPAGARIIQFDMDATLIGQNRSADVGVVGNIGAALEQLTDLLEASGLSLDFGEWSDGLRADEDAAAAALESQLTSDESPVDPLRFAAEIRDFIDEDTILIGDGGDIVAQASKVVPVLRENCWMDPGPLGTLGVGMPFALAAQHSFPDRRVLIIYGDGAFGLNGFEYDTAVRFGLPIVGIVGNDAAWGQMLRPQVGIYGADRKVAVDLAPTRYDLVVEALGGHGEYCERPDEIRPALERAFASGKPALVNVMIRKDEGAPKGSTYV